MKKSRKNEKMTVDLPHDPTASEQAGTDKAEYERRNKEYTAMLALGVSSAKHKEVFKCIFFGVALLILLVLIVVPVLVMIVIVQKEVSNPVIDLTALASSLVSVISALTVLPKIIVQHLFPANENDYVIELMKNMQTHDAKIRDTLNKRGRT